MYIIADAESYNLFWVIAGSQQKNSLVNWMLCYLKWLQGTFKCLWKSLVIPLMIINNL